MQEGRNFILKYSACLPQKQNVLWHPATYIHTPHKRMQEYIDKHGLETVGFPNLQFKKNPYSETTATDFSGSYFLTYVCRCAA